MSEGRRKGFKLREPIPERGRGRECTGQGKLGGKLHEEDDA
jgi:hypothetical protein